MLLSIERVRKGYFLKNTVASIVYLESRASLSGGLSAQIRLLGICDPKSGAVEV